MWSLILLLATSHCTQNYPNPRYYGSWALNFFEPENLTSASFSLVTFSTIFARVNATHYYFVCRQKGVVKLMGPRGIEQVIGVPNLEGNMIGDYRFAKFNQISGIHYYLKQNSSGYEKVVFTKDQSCSLLEPGCLITPKTTLSIENLRIVGTPAPGKTPTLLIADKGNHCVKEVDLTRMSVSVVAGKCGTPGFQDGPLSFSTMERPLQVGTDRQGRVFIIANNYIRMLEKKVLTSLLQGACTLFSKEGQWQVSRYWDSQFLCYANWTKSLQPDKSYQIKSLALCSKQYSICLYP